VIVGTAGHIDHGKTTLVRALTGVDTDRLPEEKKRGISIELGYAFMPAPGGQRIGFIDVPGHERLVHTMLSGATGIDYALLLVAADDGVMPQTREHLAVLSLLGITRGAVVLTKIDRADAARRAAVRAEVAALLQGSTLAAAPVLEVSATNGAGVDELAGLLHAEATQTVRRSGSHDGFRLAIDRVFTLEGVGTVATGTVHAGVVRIGDELACTPGAALSARVRSLHAQNRNVSEARAGERCAVGLAGVAREALERGRWLVAPALALATSRIDVLLSLWHAEAKLLRSGTVVHVHLGAASAQGSVALLDAEALAPGAQALAQLVLHTPLAAWRGDRVVLRDASATRTLAGGVVLDPLAPPRYRRTPARLAELAAARETGAQARLHALLAASAQQGLDVQRWAAAQGLAQSPALPADAVVQGPWALAALHADGMQAKLIDALTRYHEQHAEELGPDAARLRRLALPRLPEPLFRALLARGLASGALVLRGAFVHRPEHAVRLSASEERIGQKVAPRLVQAGFEGAWARDLARDSGESEALVRTTLARLAQRGELHQVVKDLFYAPATMARLAAIVREVAAAHAGIVTAAAYRDATQLGRKRAIQLLEHFDRVGLLRRVGDEHRLRADCLLFAQEQGTGR
jgi:selenocysteine-specific elongation factor